jgi:hypothetical protein
MTRELSPRIRSPAFDALAAFLDGIVRKADDVEILHSTGADVYLDLDEVGVDTVDRGADGFEEHGVRQNDTE